MADDDLDFRDSLHLTPVDGWQLNIQLQNGDIEIRVPRRGRENNTSTQTARRSPPPPRRSATRKRPKSPTKKQVKKLKQMR